MKRPLAELDYVEVTADLSQGIVEGARGTIVSIQTDICTVEFVDADGFTIGLVEIPASQLELVEPSPYGPSIARED